MRFLAKFTATAMATLLVSLSAHALTITPTYTNGTETQKAVVNAAIADWLAVLGDPVGKTVTLSLTIDFKTLTGAFGETGLFTADANKLPKAATISFETSMFWDTTLGTAGDIPATSKDGYTTARHELGHALGFGVPWMLFDACITGTAFNCNGVTATMAGTSTNARSHLDSTAHPGDLMDLSSGPLGVRNNITLLDVKMLRAAFAYVPDPSTGLLVVLGLAALSLRGSHRRV